MSQISWQLSVWAKKVCAIHVSISKGAWAEVKWEMASLTIRERNIQRGLQVFGETQTCSVRGQTLRNKL